MKKMYDHFTEYECLNAIGNSLNLIDMITEVITTFVRCSGARGGEYFETTSPLTPLVHFGESFDHKDTYTGNILQLPVAQGNFLFLFDHEIGVESAGLMLSKFRTKLSNAIDSCLNVENLRSLTLQISLEKSKNEVTEQLMISQSRLAIMGEMIGMIAHQWRQPITVIGMLTNNVLIDIQMGGLKQDRLIKDLESIDKQVHFLSHTIDDFRNFFRPNKLPQAITFGEIKSELISIIGKNFENNRLTLQFEGKSDINCVTYKNELLQLFLNLLNNAKDAFMEHTIPAPLIRFELIEHPSSLQFLVSDNAGGIRPEILTHIFEPYFSTKSEKNGTGLGLYMSAIIVEKHLKGAISVSSDNGNSTFSITIPKSIDQKGCDVY